MPFEFVVSQLASHAAHAIAAIGNTYFIIQFNILEGIIAAAVVPNNDFELGPSEREASFSRSSGGDLLR